MCDDWKSLYLNALRSLNTREVAENTPRAYRTLHSYVKGERGIPPEAAEQLVEYLRSRAESLTAAADQIEAALKKEEEDDE